MKGSVIVIKNNKSTAIKKGAKNNIKQLYKKYNAIISDVATVLIQQMKIIILCSEKCTKASR